MYCQNCGTRNPDGAKFCAECGARMAPEEFVRYSADSGIEDNVKPPRKKKRRWLRWIVGILFVLLVAFGLLIASFLASSTKNLYTFSKMTIDVENWPKEERDQFESVFKGTYLLKEEDGYLIFDPETGGGLTERDMRESLDGDDTIQIEFSAQGNYAHIILSDNTSDDEVTISYFKASLKERMYFISRYFSWE